MKNVLHGFHISGICSALPAATVALTELAAEYGEAEISRIIASTGIRQVHIAPPDVCSSDLCQAAADHLLSALDLAPGEIDALLFLSQTPDWPLPPTACALQHRLGLSRNSVALDVNYGCSAYIYGLFLAGNLIQTGSCRRVLVCAGDTISRLIHPQDKAVRVIFGDAGSATLVEATAATDQTGQWPFILHTDGGGANHLMVPAGAARQPHSAQTGVATERESGNWRSDENLFMDGMEILNFSLREVPPLVTELLAMRNWSHAEANAGAVILHQANRFMVDYLRRKLKLDPAAVPIAVEEVGNTGPASIPLTLCQTHQRLRQEQRLQRTLLCGFGVGLSWGGTAGNLANTLILDPIAL